MRKVINNAILIVASAFLGAVALWAFAVNHYDDNDPGCWHEVNKSQPMGLEKVCNHE